MPENPYHRVAYRTFPRRQTHPDRLATIGRLFGMRPASITQCRMLEIGCGDGGNLVPLAYTLSGSEFVGIDLAAGPVRQARAAARALGLRNVEVRPMDLRKLDDAGRKFDYIVAHGLYSWIGADAREALLERCRSLLAPQGIAYISYNAYPGSYERRMLREMLLYRRDDVRSGRTFLRTVRHEEAAALADSPDDILYHDILAPVYHPVWFHEFAAHARRAGLQYLGEADAHDMFDERGRLMDEAGEQDSDFRRVRRFRQTLLCRSEAPLTRRITPRQMDGFLFSKNRHGNRVPGDDAAVEAVVQALEDMDPLPVEFEELAAYAGGRKALREILLALVASGCADPHVHEFPCADEVSEYPRASALARMQAREGRLVTSLCHIPVQLDEAGRQLLLLLDGSHGLDELARELGKRPGAGKVAEIRRALPGSLAWMAGMALLED